MEAEEMCTWSAMLRWPRIMPAPPTVQCAPMRALKNVTANEPFFVGHFPKRPVMPGVLMLEALAQASALLSFETEGISLDDSQVFYFVGIDGARFKRPVEPGDQLILHTAMDRARAGIYKFNVKATVDDEVACEAVLMCTRRQVS